MQEKPTRQPQPPSLFATPAGAAPPPASAARECPAVWTVSQLTSLVRIALQDRLPEQLHVVGQISNFTRAATGHLYFTLKDDASEVKCVMWRSAADAIRFRPTDGLEVVATGGIDVYEPRGQYQLYVRRLEPRGVGALELAFRQLKEKLGREGLFAPERKRPLPKFPRCVAVVTSLSGAAVRDIVQTIQRRYPCVYVLLYDVRVQGDGAAAEIAEAIRRLNRNADRLCGIDVVIVGRGGGSLEDLWAFNEEVVARAIFASEIPVVSAVGHEVDFTIADFVADVRAATPTAAAELVTPRLADLLTELGERGHRLVRAVRTRLDRAAGQLTAVERSAWFREPIDRVRRKGQTVDEVSSRLRFAVGTAVARRKTALHGLEVRLARVRPSTVLAQRRERLAKVEHRLHWAGRGVCQRLERMLADRAAHLAAASPRRRIEVYRVRLEGLERRLAQVVGTGLLQHRKDMATHQERLARLGREAIDHRHKRLAALAARLEASNPRQILARGYSITRRKKTGQIVADPAQLRDGERVVTEVATGIFESRVVDGQQGELFE